jgi:hypothetical protein
MNHLQNEFVASLVASGPHPQIASSNQIFAPFVGSWDLLVSWFDENGRLIRRQAGEWHFSWVLEGRAIQDIWIVPPRTVRHEASDLYEYGASMRFFDPGIDAWRSTWIGPMHGLVRTFIAKRFGDRVVLETTEGSEPRMRWSFSDIAPHSFNWSNEVWEHGCWRLQQSFRCQRR